jgi:pyruvate-ferredoxin/flavodoxin oxidoreductase
VYPITPSTGMSQHVEEWATTGPRRNAFGNKVEVRQMQSEAGVAGALHGALQAGALASTFTSSQGLLLLVPTLLKIAGEGLPLVAHVAARAVSANGVTIFADHSDVNAARAAAVGMISSHDVQEAHDLAAVAHVAAVASATPMVHFFEGMQVSHEVASVGLAPYDVLAGCVPRTALAEFRARALSPARPRSTGVVLGRETFWQQAEADNMRLLAVAGHVEAAMAAVAHATGGRRHKLIEFSGCADAERVVVAMGAGAQTVELAADRLRAQGERVGVVKVHLYRPWSSTHFLAALPRTVRRIAVLDRAYEPMASGEPLFLDVVASLRGSGHEVTHVCGGRYGIGDHDFTVAMAESVFRELGAEKPRARFSVGIVDDVTHLSLPLPQPRPPPPQPPRTAAERSAVQCMFWGVGGDGTVSANRSAAAIVCEQHEDVAAQVVFQFDAHKTGGVTVSHVRFAGPGTHERALSYHGPIGPGEADFVACHVPSYLRRYDVVGGLREGGTLLLNAPWWNSGDIRELEEHMPARVRKALAQRKAKLFVIDATRIARTAGLGNHTSGVLAAAFFKLSGVAGPAEQAAKHLKDAAAATYGKRSAAGAGNLAAMNAAAIDAAISSVTAVDYPQQAWATCDTEEKAAETGQGVPEHVRDIVGPLQRFEGMDIPVSAMLKHANHGSTPHGTAAFEKRGIAEKIPVWTSKRCIQCNRCALVCPHAAIRPFLLKADSPMHGQLETIPALGQAHAGLKYRLQVSPLDCTSCGACERVCPTRALEMGAISEGEAARWNGLVTPGTAGVVEVAPGDGKMNVRTSQLARPLLEFAGSCSGCPEPVYSKLLTQLFGDRLVIANGIGCSTVWSGTGFCSPLTTGPDGRGPAWACSLFENAAEFGYGITVGFLARRRALHRLAGEAILMAGIGEDLKRALMAWCASWQSTTSNADVDADVALQELQKEHQRQQRQHAATKDKAVCEHLQQMAEHGDLFRRRTHWIVGGDGWAHDIGFGGLDHILSTREAVRVLVLDNENYANTGGQQSKATPLSAVAKLASGGKVTEKKDLGVFGLVMHPGAYVASVCYGADPEQTIKALQEADRHDGPAIVIAYVPCTEHQPQGGFDGATALDRMRLAVRSGYWPLFRRRPGHPIDFDSVTPNDPALLQSFLASEGRFSALHRADAALATRLHGALRSQITTRDAVMKAINMALTPPPPPTKKTC